VTARACREGRRVRRLVIAPKETTFGGLTIEYDDHVIEPRSWTTAQSHWAADLLRTSPDGPLLELCSGAGHIGLLAVTLSPRPLVQVDLNPVACAYARANATAAKPAEEVRVLEGPMDSVLGPAERFVGVIADPPWVPSADTQRFPEDPLLAIDGGPEGVDLARACVEVASRHLVVGGWVLLQLGTEDQVEALRTWLAAPTTPGLEIREVRSYGERGVLVHLR
jgi:methylase of polypeptide subunit release factors